MHTIHLLIDESIQRDAASAIALTDMFRASGIRLRLQSVRLVQDDEDATLKNIRQSVRSSGMSFLPLEQDGQVVVCVRPQLTGSKLTNPISSKTKSIAVVSTEGLRAPTVLADEMTLRYVATSTVIRAASVASIRATGKTGQLLKSRGNGIVQGCLLDIYDVDRDVFFKMSQDPQLCVDEANQIKSILGLDVLQSIEVVLERVRNRSTAHE